MGVKQQLKVQSVRSFMSGEKKYGIDGPPQLYGRVEEVSSHVLDQWLTTGAECVEKFRDARWWRKRVRCKCGCVDSFEIYIGDASRPNWISGKLGGCQRADLLCAKCGDELLLFDDGIHGYNAVVCDDRAHLPMNYLQSNRALLQKLTCGCGGSTYSVIVEVMYDCDDGGVEDIPASQWDDAYGCFRSSARCSSCGKIHEIAFAETA